MRREVEPRPGADRRQKRFLDSALTVWGGVASNHLPPLAALGYTGRADFDADTDRLGEQLSRDSLAEINWASDMFGAGVEFELVNPFRDPEALVLLRSIQRVLIRTVNPALLFPAANTDHPR